MSLTGCIKKAGAFLDPEDKAALLARVQTLKAGGMKADDAARQAVREQLDHVDGLIKTGNIPPSQERTIGGDKPQDAKIQQLTDKNPDTPVRLPGADKTVTLAEAMKQVEAEHRQELGYADMVKAALDCALG